MTDRKGKQTNMIRTKNGLPKHCTWPKTTITALLWLDDDPERMRILREIRESMTSGERARLNSPISARQRVEKVVELHRKMADDPYRGRQREPFVEVGTGAQAPAGFAGLREHVPLTGSEFSLFYILKCHDDGAIIVVMLAPLAVTRGRCRPFNQILGRLGFFGSLLPSFGGSRPADLGASSSSNDHRSLHRHSTFSKSRADRQ
jgi:hypothetical protein